MSCEKGNVARRRPQRHQNARAFKNDKYDTSARLKVGAGLGLGRVSGLSLGPPLGSLRAEGRPGRHPVSEARRGGADGAARAETSCGDWNHTNHFHVRKES